jgi:hypothetical protein
VYVSPDGDDTTGSSWAHAKKTLQPAINQASTNGCEVWVKAGTYYPGTDISSTFTLANGVDVYGGFVGTESKRDERNWQTNVTTLSGDVDHDGTYTNNVCSVVSGATGATLDGFTVTGGYARGLTATTCQEGAGMLNVSSSPTVRNCTFTKNWANSGGSGMYNWTSSPTVINCVFSDNFSNMYGGGMGNMYSSPTVTGCTFRGNSAKQEGGGMYNIMSSPIVTNSIFEANATLYLYGQGAGMNNSYTGTPVITNCLFVRNGAQDAGGGMRNYYGATPRIINCTFMDNAVVASNAVGPGLFNDQANVTVTNSILWSATAGDQIANQSSTVTVANSDVRMETAGTTYPGVNNLNLDPLFVSSNSTDATYLRLSASSPCRDASGASASTDDILGHPAYDVPGVGCAPATATCSIRDMGAYEYQP